MIFKKQYMRSKLQEHLILAESSRKKLDDILKLSTEFIAWYNNTIL
ncbi:hypothetical protein G9F73_007475 [Clostridium estertheticum]|nr:hypothetical protein [Clostridium estertheticum]MBZ9607654.1 hypothetical protein [Clostridium estertheticum]